MTTLSSLLSTTSFRGEKGNTGTISVGTTTVVNPSVSPSVLNTGTPQSGILNFSLPRAANIIVGSTSTSSPGANAQVSPSYYANGDLKIDFTLPRGPFGTVNTSQTAPNTFDDGGLWWNPYDGVLYVRYQDVDSSQWVAVSTGTQGRGGTITLGNVTYTYPNALPVITNTGTVNDSILNFTLPLSANISVGTVTTGSPNTSVIVTSTRTNGNVAFNFTIPQGAVGPQGPTGSVVYVAEVQPSTTSDGALWWKISEQKMRIYQANTSTWVTASYPKEATSKAIAMSIVFGG